MKKKKAETIKYCRDCKHASFDMQFKNLSLDGKPTLIVCPFQKWKKVVTERACIMYELKTN